MRLLTFIVACIALVVAIDKSRPVRRIEVQCHHWQHRAGAVTSAL